MSDDLIDIPDVCTLPTAERPLRQAEFDDLFATVTGSDRLGPGHLRLVLSAPDAVVRDLTAREAQCCSFFSFTVAAQPAGVVLDIEVPVGRVAILDAIESRLPS
jgi:hypothetical protein